MITLTLARQTWSAVAVATTLTLASTSQATPPVVKTKNVHVREIHRDTQVPRWVHPVLDTPSINEATSVRSRAELEMINPG